MKPLKKAEQKNAVLNKDYYSRDELAKMLENEEIFFINEKEFRASYDSEYPWTEELRIFLEDMKDIKVILDDYGQYTTVCVTPEGKQYYICLN